jgi:hypothetical protein
MGVGRNPECHCRFQLRPEGPTFNSHAREGVVAIVLIDLEARRAGTLTRGH